MVWPPFGALIGRFSGYPLKRAREPHAGALLLPRERRASNHKMAYRGWASEIERDRLVRYPKTCTTTVSQKYVVSTALAVARVIWFEASA